MSTLVVYSDTSDGVVNSGSEQPDYATAQLGTYYLTTSSANEMVQGGQATGNTGDPDYIDTYVILLIYESFDTSSIGAGNTVSAATLNLRLSSAGRASWAVRARMHDWGTSLTTADWVDTQTITGKTLVAHLDVPTNITDVSSDFTNDAFPANINRTGSTRIVLSDTWIDAGQAPTGNETWSIRAADYTGTTYDPKLTVTYSSIQGPTFAQSQAQVKQTYKVVAQAQAQIKQSYQVVAQAQAQVKQTNKVYAQALADIKQTYPFAEGGTLVVYGTPLGVNGEGARSGGYDSITYSAALQGTGLGAIDTHFLGQDILAETWEWVWDDEQGEDVWTKVQSAQVWIYESHLQFDTSGIGSGTSVSAAVLGIWPLGTSDPGAANLLAFKKTGGFHDWVVLPTSMTQVAHFSSVYTWSSMLDVFTTFDDDAMAANVEKTSNTNLLMVSALSQSATATHAGWMSIHSSDESGTTRDPKLTITYSSIQGPTFAQSQAQIKTTYYTVAQSQARIKNTYYTVAQAQTTIAAAESVTYRAYGQSQGQIKAVYQTWAQAQSQIKRTYTPVAQANTWIRQTYPFAGGGWSTGIQLGTGGGSVRGIYGRKAVGYNSTTYSACLWDLDNPSQDPTDLGGVESTSATGIYGTRIVGNTDLRAVLWNADNPTASPTELGLPPNVYDSQVAERGSIYGDYAVGTCRILPNYDNYAYVWDLTNPTAAPTKLNLNGGTSSDVYGIWGTKVLGLVDSVYVVWDLDHPTDAPVSIGFGSYVSITPKSIGSAWIGGRIYDAGSDYPGKWAVSDPTAGPTAMDGVPTAEILASNGSVGGGRSQPNGSSQATVWDLTGTSVEPLLPPPDFYTSYVYVVGVDIVGGVLESNPTVWEYSSIQGPTFAQTQAQIKTTYQVVAQAQTDIRTTYQAVAQSQARIKQIYLGFAQAQSQIKNIYQGYAQAQVKIATTRIFAQAIAQIRQTYKVVAQAQSTIKQTYIVYAQALSGIKTIYRVYAQGQAQIRNTYQVVAQAQVAIQGKVHAQAQSIIRQTYLGYAQTQGWIKNTYRGYAQAQTNIKSTYQGYAQSQANIKTTYQAVAQAQGTVKTTYFGYAQANAAIKQTYQVFAQSQAKIIQTYQQYAQAQTKIATTRVHAQAQVHIKTTSYVVAQALAYIKGQGLVSAQAIANIKQTYQVVAQALADIKQTYTVVAQANTTIKSTYTVSAQAQADIKTTYRSYAQVNAWLKVTDNVTFAQAQARIVATYKVVAQSNADIRQTYTIFAQAQAHIKVLGTTGYAQSQADIKQTYSVVAQANAWIKTTANNVYAQSGAWIRATYQSYAQSAATIKSTYYGYAQANASIILSGLIVYAQAQVQIRAVGNNYAQALGYIYIPQYARPIADISNNGWIRVVI